MPTLALKDVVHCPNCGSAEVVYTCEPKCCFNHVCSACRASFQLVTHRVGEMGKGPPIEAMEPESGDPTAACAVCESLRLAVVASPESAAAATVLCSDCGTRLRLAYKDVAVS